MMGHKIRFYGKTWMIIPKYLLPLLNLEHCRSVVVVLGSSPSETDISIVNGGSLAHSLSLSPACFSDLTEILFKRT